MPSGSQKISRFALTAMVVGSMVGAGIFSLPRTFGSVTGPFGAIMAWCIAGAGMFALARVFQILVERKPHLDAGIYAYAKDGFGPYCGFLSAFGYWLVGCIADVSYWILIKSTLGAFIPAFGDGNTVPAVAVSSVALWIFHFVVLRGIKQAAAINTVITVAKILPILVFIVLMFAAIKADLFRANFFGGEGLQQTGLFEQIRATMLVTVFVFIGIEGASVYSRYARRRSDVGFATIAGFSGVLLLMVLVTLLPYAALGQADIAQMRQPSMASVLGAIVGPWGTAFVSVGLILSVLGAYLAWSLICIEVLFAAAKTGDMPKILATENENKVPSAALWLTNAVIQVFLISTLFSEDAFKLMVQLTSVMVLLPYLFVAAYGLLLSRRGANRGKPAKTGAHDLFIAGAATLYAIFLIYAAGLKFLFAAAILYAPGTALYVWARRERGLRVFTAAERVLFAVVAAGAVAGIVGFARGLL
jgi:arginine:ornithine antiporter/lysine permease